MIDLGVIENIIQTAAAIAAAAAAFFSFQQGKLLSKQSKLIADQCNLMAEQLDTDRYLRQNERAVELARLFANEIVPKSSYLTSACN